MKTKIFKHKLLTAGAIAALGLGFTTGAQAQEAYAVSIQEISEFNVKFEDESGVDILPELTNIEGNLRSQNGCVGVPAGIPDLDVGGFTIPGNPPTPKNSQISNCGSGGNVDNNFNREGEVGDYGSGDAEISDTGFTGTGAAANRAEAYTTMLFTPFSGSGDWLLSVDFTSPVPLVITPSFVSTYWLYAKLVDNGPTSAANASLNTNLLIEDVSDPANPIEVFSMDVGPLNDDAAAPPGGGEDGNIAPGGGPEQNITSFEESTVLLPASRYRLIFSGVEAAAVVLDPPPRNGDHFLCYKSFGSFLREEVNLFDQFDTDEGINFDVLKPKMFCNPAIKPELDPDAMLESGPHYLSYKINEAHREPRHERKMVEVQNQFGTMIVETFKPDRLMVPSGKSLDLAVPPTIPAAGPKTNHYKCYTVKATGFQSPGEVAVLDQFTDEDGKKLGIVRPTRLCNPVEKTRSDGTITLIIEDPNNELDHLMCYSVRAGAGERLHKKTKVLSDNQFGSEELVLKRELEFCVPTMKTLLTPAP